MCSPTISRALSTKRGSLESLNVSLRRGCSPNAVHILQIVVCDNPVATALFIRHRAWATGAMFVGEPRDPVLDETPPPFANRVLMYAAPFGDLFALQAFRAKQNHPAPTRQQMWGLRRRT